MIRKLGPSDYRVMPWKNGLGSTTELLIHPAGATLEGGFLWRISMADVAASGPFSPFPGVDRTLMLLSGDGLALDHGAHGAQRLPGPLRPVAFPGDWATNGRLLGGACRDFNVLSARDRARHVLQVARLEEGPAHLPAAPVLAVVCLEGRAKVEGVLLEPMETLVLEPSEGAEAQGDAVLAVVQFHPRP